ncbi:MAG TPA: amidohydrolase family protein [Acidimicrobiales bacterium]
MLDMAIRGGHVVDGTGAPRHRADIGIEGGRIVAIGDADDVGPARETVDATDLVVTPGFVDVHSHFDAQVFWDPALTPSSLHGVTTALAGNCGFTLAPMDDESLDYLVRMLAVMEGMPLDALRAGVPGNWRSTADYLDRVDGALAINAGFMVGHSALRRVVMGPAANEREATDDEIDKMRALLAQGLEAGGLGFSSSWGAAHFDGDGRPVPSRFASRDELIALASVCRDHPGTSLEFLPSRVDRFDDGELDLLSTMSRSAQRPLNWNVVRISPANPREAEEAIAAARHAREHGARVVVLNMPIPSRSRFSFKTGFVLDALPDWGEVMALPVDERIRALREPEVRARLAAGVAKAKGGLAEIADFGNREILQTFSPDVKQYEGRLVADIARERGVSPLDALLDIVCDDGLQTMFARPTVEPTKEDWDASVAAWRDGTAIIGASDAGAHLDFTAYFDYPVYVLQKAVREQGALSFEEAVHFMTDVPARLYGLVDRGRIGVGAFADLVVLDEAEVASGEIAMRFDLPAGAGRLYSEPKGIHRVVVNGTTVVDQHGLTGARPGTLLRSGRDTRTPSLSAV